MSHNPLLLLLASICLYVGLGALLPTVMARSYMNGLIFYDLRTGTPYLPPTVSVSRGRNLASVKYSEKGSIWSTFGQPCDCQGGKCGCCAGLNVEQYKFDQKLCANVTFMPQQEQAQLDVFLNEKPSSKYAISVRNPTPFCIPVMMGVPMAMCVQMTDISMVGNNLNMCMDFVVRLATTDLFEMHFQCMRMGLDGLMYVDKNGQPVLPSDAKTEQLPGEEEEEYAEEDEEANEEEEDDGQQTAANSDTGVEYDYAGEAEAEAAAEAAAAEDKLLVAVQDEPASSELLAEQKQTELPQLQLAAYAPPQLTIESEMLIAGDGATAAGAAADSTDLQQNEIIDTITNAITEPATEAAATTATPANDETTSAERQQDEAINMTTEATAAAVAAAAETEDENDSDNEVNVDNDESAEETDASIEGMADMEDMQDMEDEAEGESTDDEASAAAVAVATGDNEVANTQPTSSSNDNKKEESAAVNALANGYGAQSGANNDDAAEIDSDNDKQKPSRQAVDDNANVAAMHNYVAATATAATTSTATTTAAAAATPMSPAPPTLHGGYRKRLLYYG